MHKVINIFFVVARTVQRYMETDVKSSPGVAFWPSASSVSNARSPIFCCVIYEAQRISIN